MTGKWAETADERVETSKFIQFLKHFFSVFKFPIFS